MFVPLVSLAALGYTYIGYPLLIGALAKLRPLEVSVDSSFTPMVSALIPAYNCAAYLDAKIDSLLALDYPKDKLEILILSDGSTDGTDALLQRRALLDPRVKPLRRENRSGKPSALNAMKQIAVGEVLLLTDARQPLEPNSLRALVRHFTDPTVGCVSGNLVLKGETGSGVYWRYENWIREQEATFRSMVGVTGPIYAIRKTDFHEVPEDIVLDDVWTPMRLRLAGKKVLFEKAAIAHDDAFDDDREFGRKARTLAGNFQVFSRLPKLLSPFTNPSFFETFSHKLLRLAGPWVLGALATSSLHEALRPAHGSSAARVWAMRGLAAGQAVFYVAALAGPKAGKFPAVARTFVMMNAAAVAGLYRHLRGAQRITW